MTPTGGKAGAFGWTVENGVDAVAAGRAVARAEAVCGGIGSRRAGIESGDGNKACEQAAVVALHGAGKTAFGGAGCQSIKCMKNSIFVAVFPAFWKLRV